MLSSSTQRRLGNHGLTEMLWKMVTGEDGGRVTWMDAGSIHGSHKSKQG